MSDLDDQLLRVAEGAWDDCRKIKDVVAAVRAHLADVTEDARDIQTDEWRDLPEGDGPDEVSLSWWRDGMTNAAKLIRGEQS